MGIRWFCQLLFSFLWRGIFLNVSIEYDIFCIGRKQFFNGFSAFLFFNLFFIEV